MIFNSLEFGVFFVLVLGVYVALARVSSRRPQNLLLLLASYLFYGAWDWRFLGLIWISTAVDYWVGLRLHQSTDAAIRKRWVTLSLITNLGILGFFKYAGFFVDSLTALLRSMGVTADLGTLDIVLPVGISFYTFQTLSYTVDIYRRRLEPTRDLLDFALFVAFFPQLVAGPIERATRLLPQIAGERQMTWQRLSDGSWLIFWGLFKKVVIGDNLGGLVNIVYAPGVDPFAPEVILATYAFALQIYCDFSGYTDIARGVAKILGFELMLNFNLPYFALNPADFWRRWHISLSTWLRDYLYISLGGNRQGTLMTYRNLALTMLLGGLWHGAAWTFVVWGAYQGLLLIVHRVAAPGLSRIAPSGNLGQDLWRGMSRIVTFQFVCVGWMIFRAESVGQIGDLLGSLAGPWELGLVSQWWLPFAVLATPLVLMQICQFATDDLDVVKRLPVWLRAPLYVGLFFTLVLMGEDFGQPFIYFQF